MNFNNYDKDRIKACTKHFQKRMFERKGLDLTEYEVLKISDQILSGYGEFLGISWKDLKRCFYQLKVQGEVISIVFDTELLVPVTVLSNKHIRKKPMLILA